MTEPDPIAEPTVGDDLPAPGTRFDDSLLRVSAPLPRVRAQAISRLVITILLELALAAYAVLTSFSPVLVTLLLFGLCYGVASGLYYLWLTRHDQDLLGRRAAIFSMVVDVLAGAFVTVVAGAEGLAFYPVFMWIIVANGLRFGRRRLRLAAALILPAFLFANLANGTAAMLPGVVAGLTAGLLLLPAFLHLTLAKMADAQQALARRTEQAHFLATHDPLTALPNRPHLLQRLKHAIERAERRGERLAVLFLDLDGFKSVNDSLGHDNGDLLLRSTADCLRGTVRRMDTVSRLGGDEFILLIEDCDHTHDVSAVVERVFQCARRNYGIAGTEVYVTWSCGIAVYPKDGRDGDTLIRHADVAMYRAKAGGGNRAVSYDPTMSEEILADLRLREELRRALDAHEFRVHYQPLYRDGEDAPVGLEALVRWHHPSRGLLLPSAFLSVADGSGLLLRVDRQVFAKAIADVAALRRDYSVDLRLAVNIAPRHLRDPAFADMLAELLRAHGLPANRLDLELTERALLEESDTAAATLGHLRELGMRITLDDFGTGQVSLAQLRHGAIDTVKLDGRLLRGIPRIAADCVMLEGILDIATGLGLTVTAEGVEQDDQHDWLVQRGCRLLQGYRYGEPTDLSTLRQALCALRPNGNGQRRSAVG
jgi:diguanylate cyclase (GGDEF)-like protein